MSIDNTEKINKLKTFAENKDLALFDTLNEMNDNLRVIADKEIPETVIPPLPDYPPFPEFPKPVEEITVKGLVEALKNVKGIPGDKGDTPTEKELLSLIKPLIPIVKDGQNPNPEDVVPLVLKQIKLPEYKEPVLDTGEQIVDKINDLEIEPDKQIDASHIKGLEKKNGKVIVNTRPVDYFDETTLVTTNPSQIKYQGTGVAATVDAGGALIVTISSAGTVTSVGATSPITSSGGTTPTISTSMASNKLIGRGTAGTGVMEEITLGTNLTLSGTTLNAAGGSMSIGGTVTSGTTGSVLFIGGSAALAQDNANFFWDDSNNRLGIGTATPTAAIDINGNINVKGVKAYYADSANGNLSIANNNFQTSVTSGQYNTVIGDYAGGKITSAQQCVAIGFNALGNDLSGNYNVAVGVNCLSAATNLKNVAVGSSSFTQMTSGINNVGLGADSGYSMLDGANNFALGTNALYSNQHGGLNVAIGTNALQNGTTGDINVCLGGMTNVSGNYNIGIGTNMVNGTSVEGNIAIGINNLNALTTGDYNIALGFTVGSGTLTTGSRNILIGTDSSVTTPASGTNDFLNIQNSIYATSLGTGALVGIGVAAPSAAIHLKASTSAANTGALKFTTGVLATTPESGLVEFDGINWYLTT